MKKKYWIVAALVIVVLGVLVVPYRIHVLNDGGTKEYRALTYRVVDWNCLTDDGIYEKTRVYFFDDLTAPINELWEREEPNVAHRFIATVVEINGGTTLVEPVEYEWERSSSDRISFGISQLPDIGAEVGSVVEITYDGTIMESYPAQINAKSWKLSGDLRHMEYSEPTSSETNSISEYLTEEDGKQYLMLPISKDKVMLWDGQAQYLDDIDLDLLKAAEEKISKQISQYSNNSGFYLQVDEGYLCLYAEVIVKIDPPASAGGVGGCGIDHEHMFFGERITN